MNARVSTATRFWGGVSVGSMERSITPVMTALGHPIMSFSGNPGDSNFQGATLSLSDTIVVRYTVKCSNLTQGTTLEVSVAGKNFSIPASQFVATDTVNVYHVDFTGLSARQMRTPIRATICRDGVPVSMMVTCSVESYVHRIDPSTDVGKLCQAMMYYGDSAKAYLG